MLCLEYCGVASAGCAPEPRSLPDHALALMHVSSANELRAAALTTAGLLDGCVRARVVVARMLLLFSSQVTQSDISVSPSALMSHFCFAVSFSFDSGMR